jgi:hypothetical protein
VYFHVFVVVCSLSERLTAPRDIASEGTLSRVNPQMVTKVVSLLEKSGGGVIARKAICMIAFPNLELSLGRRVDEGVGTVGA